MIDLFCGLGGGTEGALEEGYDCIGFDRERHRYPAREVPESHAKGGGGIDFARHDSFNGTNEKRLRNAPLTGGWDEYPAQLVLQDALTIHGKQCRHAAYIWASPPCQEFSYMAMPWRRTKQIAAALRGHGEFPEGYTGSRTIAQLTALFDACFRIQREACEAAGRYIPMVVENVKGAQPWVGRAKANFGSFYLWGDVAMVGNRVVSSVPAFGQWTRPMRAQKFNPDDTEHPQGSWFKIADSKERGVRGAKSPAGNCGETLWKDRDVSRYAHPTPQEMELQGIKVEGFNFHEHEKTGKPGRSFQSAAVESQKQPVWFNDDKRRATKCGGDWFGPGDNCSLMRSMGSKSSARKAASAQIAKIPFALSQYIARAYKPR